MSDEPNILDLEDLARRYDPQILREYLHQMDQEGSGGVGLQLSVRNGADRVSGARADEDVQGAENGEDVPHPPWSAVHDLRLRCARRLRAILVINFLVYWSAVAYCGYTFHLRVQEHGLKALPPIEVSLLGVLVLGTQATVEFAAAACLTQPARAIDARRMGFRSWDGAAWLVGASARCAILLDVQVLPLLWRGSRLLFILSCFVFSFAIGIFVFIVQLRQLCGLFCSADQFAYDKPDLFFKGRDTTAAASDSLGTPLAAGSANTSPSARDPGIREELDRLEPWRIDRPPPTATIKIANLAQLSDLSLLHAVLTRLYIPIGSQESQEFMVSITSYSRCFCEDIIQCTIKFFFLMDCETNALVLISFLISIAQALASCSYASTSLMDIRSEDGDQEA